MTSPTSRAAFFLLAVSGLALGFLPHRTARAEPGRAPVAAPRSAAAPAPLAVAPESEGKAPSSSVVRYRLPNGLRVVLDLDQSESSVVVCLVLAVGSRHDPEGKDGAASVLSRREALEARGTAAAKNWARLRAVGATSRSEVDVDATESVTRVPPAELELALKLAAERLVAPKVTPSTLAEAKSAALGQLEAGLEELGERRLRQLVFQGSWPYSHAATGSREGITALGLADLEQLHERFVAPSSAVLSISGLFAERDARRLVQAHLGRLPARAMGATRADMSLPRQTSERFNASVDARTKLPLAFYAWPIPGAVEPAFRVVGQLLTASSRLRAPSSSAAADIDDVRAWVLPQSGATAFAVRLRVGQRSTVDKARNLLERELERLASAGPSEAELDKARSKIVTELESGLDSAITRAPVLARSELATGDARNALRESARYAKVESLDVRQAVRHSSNETRRTSVELYPPGWPQDLPPEVVRREHIVKAGETLTQIAARYHSNVDAIAAANRIRSHRFIFPGQHLTIPVKTADLERAKKRSYTVKSGDTLMGIASRFGVSTRALADANGRRRNQTIRIGETLTLPDAPRAAESAKAKAKLRQHRVKRGDSLLGLARRYGVSAADIAAANGRRPSQPILAGELLAIPAAPAKGKPK